MVHKAEIGKNYVVRSTESSTGDEWICCLSYSTGYVNIVARCNDLDPVMYFGERSSFGAVGVHHAISRVLFYYHSVPGWWRRSIVIWLLECSKISSTWGSAS
jgi:hypothetical protein